MAYSIGSAALIRTRRRSGFHVRCQLVSRVRAQCTARLKIMMWDSTRPVLQAASLKSALAMRNDRARHCIRTGYNLRENFLLSTPIVLREIDFCPRKTARANDMQ